MNHNNHQLPEQDFTDLEQYGQLLFDTTPPAPQLSKSKKKQIRKNIVGSYFNLPLRAGIGFAATAMAAFVLVFGLAQTSKPGSVLYNLKVGGNSSVSTPIAQPNNQTQAIIIQKQTDIDNLKRSGAPNDEIIKAESDLKSLIESSKTEIKSSLNNDSENSTDSTSQNSTKTGDDSELNNDSENSDESTETNRLRTRTNY